MNLPDIRSHAGYSKALAGFHAIKDQLEAAEAELVSLQDRKYGKSERSSARPSKPATLSSMAKSVVNAVTGKVMDEGELQAEIARLTDELHKYRGTTLRTAHLKALKDLCPSVFEKFWKPVNRKAAIALIAYQKAMIELEAAALKAEAAGLWGTKIVHVLPFDGFGYGCITRQEEIARLEEALTLGEYFDASELAAVIKSE